MLTTGHSFLYYIQTSVWYIAVCQLCLVSAGHGRCLAKVKIEKEHTNRSGNLHGGFTATLVDAVSTLALMTNEQGTPGVSVNINVS